MGSVASAVGGAVSDVGKGLISGGPMGPLNLLMGQGPDEPKQPGIDPKLTAIQNQQMKTATDYRNNLPSLKSQGQAQIQNTAGVQLADQNQQITRAASKRGLLYSGLKEGAQAKAGAQMGNDVSNKTANLNTTLDAQANQLDNQALTSAVQLGNLQAQQNQNAYNMAVQRQQQKAAASNAALSGAGGLIGGFAAFV